MREVAVNPANRAQFASGGHDHTLCLVDLEHPETLRTLPQKGIVGSVCNRILVSGIMDLSVWQFHASTGQANMLCHYYGGKTGVIGDAVYKGTFLEDGAVLATSSEGQLTRINLPAGPAGRLEPTT